MSIYPCKSYETNESMTCRRDNWFYCDVYYLYYLLPSISWFLFFLITFLFLYYTGVWKEYRQDIDELHDIPSQALAIVVARQTKNVLGKKILDPRRILVLIAMWIELPAFSLLPIQLLYHRFYGVYLLDSHGPTEIIKFLLNCIWFLLLLFTTIHIRLSSLRNKILLPFAFDACYVVFIFAILNILICDTPIAMVQIFDHSSCACTDRIAWYTLTACIVLCLMYAGALLYRCQVTEDVFGVLFRYPTSFSFLMTFLRTGSCLLHMTVFHLLESYNEESTAIYVSAGLTYLIAFGGLFEYNYRLQPCLGSGLFPNNMRALSFGTACWTSLALIAGSFASDSSLSLPLAFVALYPAISVFLWRLNSKRAIQYHIRNQPLIEALQHPILRVRTVAAVSITLDDHQKWSPQELCDVVVLLRKSLTKNVLKTPEDALLVAYSCQALWHLSCKHSQLNKAMVDFPSKEYIPFQLWLHITQPSMKARKSNVNGGTRFHELVDRNAEIKTRSGISTVAPISDIHAAADEILQASLGTSLTLAVKMLGLPYPQASLIAAKVLQEMYQAQNIQLTIATWVHVISILCRSQNTEVAASAALSLSHTVQQFPPKIVISLLCDPLKLNSISQLLVVDNPHLPLTILRDNIITDVLVRVGDYVNRLIPTRDPNTIFTAPFLFNLVQSWKHWQHEYSTIIALEPLFLLVQQAGTTYASVKRHKKRSGALSTLTSYGARHHLSHSFGAHSENRSQHSTRKSIALKSQKSWFNKPHRLSTLEIVIASGRSTTRLESKRELKCSGGADTRLATPRASIARRSSELSFPAHGSFKQLVAVAHPKKKTVLVRKLTKFLAVQAFEELRPKRHNVHDVATNIRAATLNDGLLKSLNHVSRSHGDLIPNSIWKEIKMRRAIRERLMSYVEPILTEGLDSKLLPQLLSESTATSLRSLVSLLVLYPSMTNHLQFALQEEEYEYVMFAKNWQETSEDSPVTPNSFTTRLQQFVRPLRSSTSKVKPRKIKAALGIQRLNIVQERRRHLDKPDHCDFK